MWKEWGSPVAPTDCARILNFDAIQPGDTASISRCFSEEDVAAFAALSGDYNPLHMDDEFAGQTRFQRRVVHGMLVASYVSTLIGMRLPGAGSLWVQQSFRWQKPVHIGDTIEITLKVKHKSSGLRTVTVEISAVNQDGVTVMSGEGAVSVPDAQSRGFSPQHRGISARG